MNSRATQRRSSQAVEGSVTPCNSDIQPSDLLPLEGTSREKHAAKKVIHNLRSATPRNGGVKSVPCNEFLSNLID